MEVDDHELLQLHISSEPYAQSGQLDAFREVWGRKMLRYELEPMDDHPLHFDAKVRSLPGFTMASGLCVLVVVAALIFLGWPYALVIAVASVIPALLIRRRRGP